MRAGDARPAPDMAPRLLLLLCLISCAARSAAGPPPPRAAPPDRWTQLLNELRGGGARPLVVDLPVGGGSLVIVPVPVPAATQCSSGQFESASAVSAYQQQPFSEHKQHYEAERRVSTGTDRPRVKNYDSPDSPDELSSGGSGYVPQSEASGEEPTVPHLDYIVSSQQLVELFQAQEAPNPELPPAVIPDYEHDYDRDHDYGEERVQRRTRHVRLRRYQARAARGDPSPALPTAPLAPPTPRFDHSLVLRGELTVPRAGYTEPYTVWWDAASGAARVELHGGATAAYRGAGPDGRVRAARVGARRGGERDVRVCTVAAPRALEPEDRLVPGLPDLQYFSFAGYSEAEFGRVERWRRSVAGRGGELGGARGEALLYRHEVLLARAPDNVTATPLRYSVSVDSSVLGADCDGYVHRYTELRAQEHEPAVLALEPRDTCEETERAARRADVEPLREYTMAHRDPWHDLHYSTFKSDHRREYLDDKEEAVRKNLLMQHSRFVDSGNRQGATFSMEVNHLGDRLDAELALLRGVREDAEGLPAESFPHSRDELAATRNRLPRRFDWRERGAISHVRNQGSCSSCWAVAVAGAVEGALFVRSRRLVPLSEQCLVDCAQPFGAHGCGGTWPSAAYDYVRERGLPPLHEYTPYQGKVLPCAETRVSPVTHISSHVNVTRNSVQALKVAIRRHAPTVVIIDSTAKSFVFYKNGVVNDERCAKNKAEHAVLAVGWDERRGAEHFIVKNSWSAAWGDAGYVRLAAAPNTCGVLSRPSYPRLERPDVLRLPAALPAAPPAATPAAP